MHSVAARIERKFPGGEQALPCRQRRGALAQRRADAGQQFLDLKGLGDIVVRAHVQTRHLVHHRVARRDHDDRRLLGAAQAAQKLHAAHARQHHVQQNKAVVAALGHFQRVAAVHGFVHAVALVDKFQFHEAGQLFLILDDEYLFLHRPFLPKAFSRAAAPRTPRPGKPLFTSTYPRPFPASSP